MTLNSDGPGCWMLKYCQQENYGEISAFCLCIFSCMCSYSALCRSVFQLSLFLLRFSFLLFHRFVHHRGISPICPSFSCLLSDNRVCHNLHTTDHNAVYISNTTNNSGPGESLPPAHTVTFK